MALDPMTLLMLTAAHAALGGALAAYLILQRRLAQYRALNRHLAAEAGAERRAALARQAAFDTAQTQLNTTFSSLATDVLRHNSADFLRLAEQHLKQFQIQAQGEFRQREQAVENLVKPIHETLEKAEAQIRRMEHDRREAQGSLTRHLETLAEAHQLLQSETRNLVQALRRPEVRGQWGEMTLKRLAELAGMVEYCDFYEQAHVRTDTGAIRPDMIVRMPDSREIIVDAKTPLDAYLRAVEASDDATRDVHLRHHARKVRERVRELAGKGYWQQFACAPDFVVLFIPGEQFLSTALDIDRKLLEDALSDKVILATPTSLVALLRAVAYGWRQIALAENAEHIRTLGEELYARLAGFGEHLAQLGKNLAGGVQSFNRAVGSFDTRVLPGARKFKEMGISTSKEVPELEPIERRPREIQTQTTAV
jgi:DNA recombination protein RmuC